ncbi:hypothetical protein [Nonomuraea endophytica]
MKCTRPWLIVSEVILPRQRHHEILLLGELLSIPIGIWVNSIS